MTPLALLAALAGLSQREAGEFLRASPSAIDKMMRGRRSTPPGMIAELRALIAAQRRGAAKALAEIERMSREAGAPDTIELGYPADDHEARSLGWPCVAAWGAMAARVVAETPLPVALVPRGSTSATAAAADAHEAARR